MQEMRLAGIGRSRLRGTYTAMEFYPDVNSTLILFRLSWPPDSRALLECIRHFLKNNYRLFSIPFLQSSVWVILPPLNFCSNITTSITTVLITPFPLHPSPSHIADVPYSTSWHVSYLDTVYSWVTMLIVYSLLSHPRRQYPQEQKFLLAPTMTDPHLVPNTQSKVPFIMEYTLLVGSKPWRHLEKHILSWIIHDE